MTDEPSSRKPGQQRSWLGRLSHLLSSEPENCGELIEVLRNAEKHAILSTDALAMIEGVLQVSEMHVRDIMIPRSQMIVVSEESTPEEFIPSVIKAKHSRFPVIGDSLDEIIGILHAKELLRFALNSTIQLDIRDVLRAAYFVPESKRLDLLLKEFKQQHSHMAIVVDEYGGVSGLVTLEDVLEQIVGDIEDEYDIEEEHPIKKQSENLYAIKAVTPVDDFNDYFSSHLSDEESITIGGLVIQKFGHLPKVDETVTIDNYIFTVTSADNRRINSLKMQKKTELNSEPSNAK